MTAPFDKQAGEEPVPSDLELETRIKTAQAALQAWAEASDLWLDSGFASHAEYVDAEPGQCAVVFVLHSAGDLARLLDEEFDTDLRSQFDKLAEEHGFFYENQNGYSFHFFATSEVLQQAYDNYFHWRWVCSLIVVDFADVYSELYQYFRDRPERLYNLHHRQFEVLLYRIFQNLGYEAEVGPGVGDGGVDVKLLQRGPLGDTLTYVQAKKYAPSNPIDLQAVAALRGVMVDDGVERGLFVTTSRYLPVAQRFAQRSSASIELKTSADVASWCEQAEGGVIRDRSKLISDDHLLTVLAKVKRGEHSHVLHASTGYNTIGNAFALVLKETAKAALLMILPKNIISHDGNGLEGFEVPLLDARAAALKTSSGVFRAKRSVDEKGEVSYWDGRHSYAVWDRKPTFFSHLD
ncbi:restriction endonuclease [Pseudomonas savastanoi]|uniref:restriction endonuclease n=1 Tax=Pseudomonas savastanoi TaxID=29438 RepID=UPI000EFFA7AB|nr:restriction endonuclease [Pseudomonas savastanoi]RML92464.1 hypothetical protein ALQ87_02060 [Pseudomonas savastanoi pv. glycinea]